VFSAISAFRDNLKTGVVVKSRRTILGLLTIALLWLPAKAVAQAAPGDPQLRAAFDAFYRGDQAAAMAAFGDLAAKRPNDLAGPFGQLLVEHFRLGPYSDPSPAFESHIDGFINRAVGRVDRDRNDMDAVFHAAFAYTLRSAYRFQHQRGVVSAARDGGKARGYIDDYLKRHPENADAYLVRGMYNYFVDLAPSFVHVFRFLLFLPGGDRTGGLKDIEFTAARGTYYSRLAQLQLVPIYGALEGRSVEALALGERLAAELPTSDDVAFAIADVYSSPSVENRERAARTYGAVIERHRTDSSPDGVNTRDRALFGLAGARFDAWRGEEAIEILTNTIDNSGAAPPWVVPRFLLRRAGYLNLLNDPRADDDVKRVLANPAWKKFWDDAKDAAKAMQDFRSSGEAPLYAFLVPANRLVVEGKYDEAQRAYETIARGHMDAAQVRYRLAYLAFARGRDAEAQPEFEALTVARGASDWIRAGSWLYLGRIDDLAGRRPAAQKAYQRVVDDYDGQRAALAAQVGLITPYKRPPRG
jgi:tetratricopeptide (TPR) repeat protein